MTTQIIDNFLPINLFKEIQKEVVYNEDFLWRHIYSLNDSQTNNLDTYFVHLVYEDNEPITTFWNIVKPIIDECFNKRNWNTSIIQQRIFKILPSVPVFFFKLVKFIIQ